MFNKTKLLEQRIVNLEEENKNLKSKLKVLEFKFENVSGMKIVTVFDIFGRETYLHFTKDNKIKSIKLPKPAIYRYSISENKEIVAESHKDKITYILDTETEMLIQVNKEEKSEILTTGIAPSYTINATMFDEAKPKRGRKKVAKNGK